MVLNRSHIPWALAVGFISAIGALLYLANFHSELLPIRVNLPEFFGPVPPLRRTAGGTPLGIVFGTLSLLIFLFASALGGRKKQRTWLVLGNVQTWLKAHIWLTILTVPFVAFHCDFKAGGPMTTTLLVIYAIVMVSGFLGLALQQFMPHTMTSRLSREVVYEQIPYVRGQLVKKAEALWTELAPSARHPHIQVQIATPHGHKFTQEITAEDLEDDASVQSIGEFLHDELFPYLRARRGDRHKFGSAKAAEDTFRLLRSHVAEKWRPRVEEMFQWADDRRQLDLQASLHHWLHGWLIVHVPLSFALLVLTFWHAFITLRYL